MVMRGLLADQFSGTFAARITDMLSKRPGLARPSVAPQHSPSPPPPAADPMPTRPKRQWVYDKSLGRLVMIE